MNRAALIYAAALDTGVGPAGAVVGIATAMQESTLGAHPAAATPNSDGDVGLFQQRSLVGWYADGTTQQENLTILADDAYQARTFYLGHTTRAGWHIPGLVDIDGWQHMSVGGGAEGAGVGLPRRLRTPRRPRSHPGRPVRRPTRRPRQLRNPRRKPGLCPDGDGVRAGTDPRCAARDALYPFQMAADPIAARRPTRRPERSRDRSRRRRDDPQLLLPSRNRPRHGDRGMGPHQRHRTRRHLCDLARTPLVRRTRRRRLATLR